MIVPALLLVAAWAAAVLLLRPFSGRAVWPLAEPLPFALLAVAGLVLKARWEEIPERFAIHFALDGRPDGWAPRTPEAVYAPLAIGAIVVAVLLLARAALSAAGSGPLATPAATASRRQAAAIFLGLELFVAAVFATTALLALGATLRLVLGVVATGIVALIGGIGASLVALSRRPPDGEPSVPGGWRAGGLVYRDAGDPDLWIPKRIGIGWTLNFGHPAAWWVLALLLGLPLALVAGLLYFVAPR